MNPDFEKRLQLMQYSVLRRSQVTTMPSDVPSVSSSSIEVESRHHLVSSSGTRCSSTALQSSSKSSMMKEESSCLLLASPQKRACGDRFIPWRNGNRWDSTLAVDFEAEQKGSEKKNKRLYKKGEHVGEQTHSLLLKSELLGVELDFASMSEGKPKVKQSNGFSFSPKKASQRNSPFCKYHLSPSGQKLLRSPRVDAIKHKTPYKILDAPEIQPDFYLNLLDWSNQNVIAVGLNNKVYLLQVDDFSVSALCTVSLNRYRGSYTGSVTSLSWNEKGNLLAVGSREGRLQIWDVETRKLVQEYPDLHHERISSIAWNDSLVATGGRDFQLILTDTLGRRSSKAKHMTGHKGEICGLRWSPDKKYLASGGNDNKLLIWSMSSTSPLQTYQEHKSAVKAIAWSPHKHGLLASGGGLQDGHIRFWNTLSGVPVNRVDTSSQICNLFWSKFSDELVSSHGYSGNDVIVWKYPSMTKTAMLAGHAERVIYLALSPDGESLVSGAGDETLRFWNVFSKQDQKSKKSVLRLFDNIR